MNQITKFAKLVALLFVAASSAAFLLYFGVKVLSARSPIHIPVHAAPYHDQYPVPYLLTIALTFAVVGALWLTFILPRFTRFRFLQIMILPWVVLLLTGPIWGVLGAYHDMQAGYFPEIWRAIDYLLFGARSGLYFALDTAYFSVPFSLLAYGAACLVLTVFTKRLRLEHVQTGSA